MKFYVVNSHDKYSEYKYMAKKGRKLLDRAIKLYGNICYLCGENVADTVDHVIPKSKGGGDGASNLLPACRKCNNEKGNKSLLKYISIKYGLTPQRLNFYPLR